MKQKIIYCLFASIFCALLTGCQERTALRLEQYYVGGKLTYEAKCANCHQKDGKGLGTLYPPIAGSDFLKNKEQVICLIRNGLSGEIKVNGKTYNQPMPANKDLLDLDIAELSTFIYNEWGGEKTITATDSVHKILERCK